MKKGFTITLFAGMLCATAAAQQPARRAAAPAPDTVLLGQSESDGWHIRRYVVLNRHGAQADYALRYGVNATVPVASLDRNGAELQGLDDFLTAVRSDTLLTVRSVEVTGYSSPDGSRTVNERVSLGRVEDFRKYLLANYPFLAQYPLSTRAVTESWSTVARAIDTSAVPDRARVMEIVRGSAADAQKELQLKRMPAAWDYLRRQVLPGLRRVEVAVHYDQGWFLEVRSRTVRPQSAPQPSRRMAACACGTEGCMGAGCPMTDGGCPTGPMVDEGIEGVLIEMGDFE